GEEKGGGGPRERTERSRGGRDRENGTRRDKRAGGTAVGPVIVAGRASLAVRGPGRESSGQTPEGLADREPDAGRRHEDEGEHSPAGQQIDDAAVHPHEQVLAIEPEGGGGDEARALLDLMP